MPKREIGQPQRRKLLHNSADAHEPTAGYRQAAVGKVMMTLKGRVNRVLCPVQ